MAVDVPDVQAAVALLSDMTDEDRWEDAGVPAVVRYLRKSKHIQL